MNSSAPTLKLALCLTAAASLHLSLLAAVLPRASTPQIAGGGTRVLLATQSASWGQESAHPDPSTDDANPPSPPPEAAAELEPNPPEPVPSDPPPGPSPQPQTVAQKMPPLPESSPEKPARTSGKPAGDANPSSAETSQSTGQGEASAMAGEQDQLVTEASLREAGNTAGTVVEANQGSTAIMDAPGNAASDSYAGLVMRHISRIPRPRAPSPGSAYVTFTVDMSGSVEQIEISKSSGSSRFDREAMKLVRQAAPFPSPPPGVNRAFEIKIEGH